MPVKIRIELLCVLLMMEKRGGGGSDYTGRGFGLRLSHSFFSNMSVFLILSSSLCVKHDSITIHDEKGIDPVAYIPCLSSVVS